MFFLLVGKDEGERGNGLERVEGGALIVIIHGLILMLFGGCFRFLVFPLFIIQNDLINIYNITVF